MVVVGVAAMIVYALTLPWPWWALMCVCVTLIIVGGALFAALRGVFLFVTQALLQQHDQCRTLVKAMEDMRMLIVSSTEQTVTHHQQCMRGHETVVSSTHLLSSAAQDVSQLIATNETVKDLVEVMSGLAFQISLLALNSSVEAARMGEIRQGFSIIVDEVRALSQRMTNATREVKDISQARILSIQHCDSEMQQLKQKLQSVLAEARQAIEVSQLLQHDISTLSIAHDALTQRAQHIQGAVV